MENSGKLIAIKRIEFNSEAEELRIQGTVSNQQLSYESSFRVHISTLNRLINALQKQNPEIEVAALLEVEDLPNGEIDYSLHTTELNNVLPAYLFEEQQTYRQIRA